MHTSFLLLQLSINRIAQKTGSFLLISCSFRINFHRELDFKPNYVGIDTFGRLLWWPDKIERLCLSNLIWRLCLSIIHVPKNGVQFRLWINIVNIVQHAYTVHIHLIRLWFGNVYSVNSKICANAIKWSREFSRWEYVCQKWILLAFVQWILVIIRTKSFVHPKLILGTPFRTCLQANIIWTGLSVLFFHTKYSVHFLNFLDSFVHSFCSIFTNQPFFCISLEKQKTQCLLHCQCIYYSQTSHCMFTVSIYGDYYFA